MQTKKEILIIDHDNNYCERIKKLVLLNDIKVSVAYVSELPGQYDHNKVYIINAHFLSEQNKYPESLVVLTDSLIAEEQELTISNNARIHYRQSSLYSLLKKCGIIINKRMTKESIEKETEGGKIIAALSPVGGCGKSTIITNLAIELAKKNKKVALLDISIYSTLSMLIKEKVGNTGLDLLVNQIEAYQVPYSEPKILEALEHHCLTFKVDTVNDVHMFYSDAPLRMEKVTIEQVDQVIEELKVRYDYILIDTSSQLSGLNISVAEKADEILLCMVPDIGAGWSMIRYKEILERLNAINKAHLIMNKYNKKIGFSVKHFEEVLDLKIMGVMPQSNHIQFCFNQSKPISMTSNVINNYIRFIGQGITGLFDKKEIKLKRIRG